MDPPVILDPVIMTLSKFYQEPVCLDPLDSDPDKNGKKSDHRIVVCKPISTINNKPIRRIREVKVRPSMCKLGELSKFLEYSSNMLEISSQFIWDIPVTYWKFPVGSKMILLFFDMLEVFKKSENNRISMFYVNLPI